MTTLLESKARPFGSSKGVALSMLIHGTVIAAAVFLTTEVVLPPREKIEEHPVLYVATPPPPPIEAPPKPLPKPPEPPKAKSPEKVFRAPAPAPRRAEAPRPVAPTTPALVAPTKIAVTIPAIDLKAAPTLSDVVTPAASDAIRASGISSSGSVKRDEGGGSGKGLGSGDSGKAFDENQVDRAVEVSRKVEPRYPESLKSVGVQGTVVMRFIVGADGRVEPGSIEAVSSPHKLFTDAVRSALLNTHYRPAEAGGRKVRQLVEQAFSFKIT